MRGEVTNQLIVTLLLRMLRPEPIGVNGSQWRPLAAFLTVESE